MWCRGCDAFAAPLCHLHILYAGMFGFKPIRFLPSRLHKVHVRTVVRLRAGGNRLSCILQAVGPRTDNELHAGA